MADRPEFETRLALATSLPETLNKDKRRFQAVANSSTEVDRHHSVIRASAWEKRLPEFQRNPQGLWAHNFCDTKPPIFSSEEMSVDPQQGLMFWPTWQREGLDPFADLIWNKYTSNPPLLRAFSVGFMPHDWIEVKMLKPEEFQGLAEFEKSAEIIYTDVEGREISAVPVPSNRGSLARGVDGRIQLDSSIIRFIEQMGFVQRTRLTTDPEGRTVGHPVSRDEILETLDLFTGKLSVMPRTELARAELSRAESLYRKLGDMLGYAPPEQTQKSLQMLEQAGEQLKKMNSVNEELLAMSLDRFVRT